MRKTAIRLSACLLGLAIGVGAIPFVQAQRWAQAICDSDVATIYSQMKDVGWSEQDVKDMISFEQMVGFTCDSATVRGLYFNGEGKPEIIVRVGPRVYYTLTYGLDGTLVDAQ